MVIVIHNHHDDSAKTYQGDKTTIYRSIEQDMPWLTEHFTPENLEDMLQYIDTQQNLSVEVLDDREHPFVRP
jgi:hypothetical protein